MTTGFSSLIALRSYRLRLTVKVSRQGRKVDLVAIEIVDLDLFGLFVHRPAVPDPPAGVVVFVLVHEIFPPRVSEGFDRV